MDISFFVDKLVIDVFIFEINPYFIGIWDDKGIEYKTHNGQKKRYNKVGIQ